jgi:hypothetical protein
MRRMNDRMRFLAIAARHGLAGWFGNGFRAKRPP